MPYIESSMDEFLEAANEGFLNGGKKSVNALLANAEKKLNKTLQTTGDCDDQLLMINNEARKFNECITALAKVKTQFDEGKLEPKAFKEQVKSANYLLKKNCRVLQMQLGNIIDDSKAVTKEELADFKSYIEGLRRIVKARKAQLAKEAKLNAATANESSLTFYMSALEGDFDLETIEKEEKDKLKKKSKDDDDEDDDDKDDKDKKSDKKKDDDSEDDFDGESLDDDDDKKDKKKKSKDDDDEDDDDDKDDDKKDKKKSKDDDEEEDDDKDKKSKDDDEDDDDDKDKDDDKKDKKKSKDDDIDLDFSDFDFGDDKKDKKKKSKDDDDEDDDDDKDKDDDKKDAKESVTDLALEYMSYLPLEFEEALEVAGNELGYNVNVVKEEAYYGTSSGSYYEYYDKDFAAKISNMVEVWQNLPDGTPQKKGYGEKIAKKIKGTHAALVLRKYGVWDEIPEELKIHYNEKALKKAMKAGKKYI